MGLHTYSLVQKLKSKNYQELLTEAVLSMTLKNSFCLRLTLGLFEHDTSLD